MIDNNNKRLKIEDIIQDLSNPDLQKKIIAIELVGYMGARGAVPHLAKLLSDDESIVRKKATWALSEIDLTRSDFAPLLDMLWAPEAEIKQSVIDCLFRYRDDSPLIRRAVPLVIQLLTDKNRKVRCICAKFITRLVPHTIKTAIQLNSHDDNSLHQSLQTTDLGKLVHEIVVLADYKDPQVLHYRSHSHPFVRLAGIVALHRFGRSSIPALLPLLSDEHPEIREITLYVLSSIGDSGIVRDVENLLNDADEDVRFQAVMALASLGIHDYGIICRISELLATDPVAHVRFGSATALGMIGPEASAVLSSVLQALDDHDLTVRQKTIEIIPALRKCPIILVQRLVEMLSSSDINTTWLIKMSIIGLLRSIVQNSSLQETIDEMFYLPDEGTIIVQFVNRFLVDLHFSEKTS